jgi:hypothetical protein
MLAVLISMAFFGSKALSHTSLNDTQMNTAACDRAERSYLFAYNQSINPHNVATKQLLKSVSIGEEVRA